EVNNKLSVYAGLRYSFYALTGKRDVIQYAADQPIEVVSMIDTVSYSGGIIKWYQGLEPRLNLRYLLSPNTSFKFSLGRTRQYLQMLSNNTAIAPTDLWKLSDSYIRPQIADQISLGWFKNAGAAFEISVEGYYKFLKTATDFHNGAVLFRNDHIETEVLNAQGKAYGVEFLVRRSTTRLSGWLSYTWSRSFLRTTGSDFVEKVNNNTWYPSNFDKPHSVNFVSNYKFNRRINVSWNLTYSTGRPITLPVARYTLDGGGRLEYSDRNAYRIPDYFRSDLAINFEGNHRIRKLAHSSWSLSIYNLTGRRNAYSVFFRTEGSEIKGYKLSIFGQAIPTLTWNFKL
ncbi:MAG: TonB-dependent receptor, partial [Cyclobacteriaceae bacterium]